MTRSKFSDKQIADLVISLIGEIEPVGETYTDDKRFNSLIKLQNVVDILLDEVSYVCPYITRLEYSMFKCGNQAYNWLDEKREWINAFLKEM